MSSNKNKLLTLKEVFLRENEISRLYGLDKSTPRNVYKNDTTANKVISHEDEDTYGRNDPEADPLSLDETCGKDVHEECGCGFSMMDPDGEDTSKNFDRVGAPGGPDLNAMSDKGPEGPDTVDVSGEGPGVVILLDTDDEGLHEGGSESEGPYDDYYQRIGGYADDEESFQDLDVSEEDYDENGPGYSDFEAEMEWEDMYANDWKPRPQRFSEAFGSLVDENDLEFI